jgi:hypothetical protein
MQDPPTKRFYRRRSDGQLGYMVERHGREMIKLDRKHDEVEPFSTAKWEPVSADRPISKAQVARIAFDADRALCKMLALHGEARKEWIGLSEQERIAWVSNGPPAEPPMRQEFYKLIVGFFPNVAA